MPFIRGRYHINPIAGAALEAAREAEAALLAQQRNAQHSAPGGIPGGASGEAVDQSDGFAYAEPDGATTSGANPSGANDESAIADNTSGGPIQRVEIEISEMVPAHSGRAERGFVARVHRAAPGNPSGPARPGEIPSRVYAPPPETHVFSAHSDLVNFLHRHLARDGKQ